MLILLLRCLGKYLRSRPISSCTEACGYCIDQLDGQQHGFYVPGLGDPAPTLNLSICELWVDVLRREKLAACLIARRVVLRLKNLSMMGQRPECQIALVEPSVVQRDRPNATMNEFLDVSSTAFHDLIDVIEASSAASTLCCRNQPMIAWN